MTTNLVQIGSANISNFDHTVLKIILAHEIGHLLGLGHSASTKALMYYDASAKTSLSLSQDDIDGISYLYPSDEMSSGKYGGCGLVTNVSPPNSNHEILVLLALLLPVLLALGLRQLSNLGLTNKLRF
ncbi:MAG TPA: matrixin family metalloprotease [Pseudobdellovibrionaceae bacterium]|jgi:hypothetical protein